MRAKKRPVIIECFKWDGDFKFQDGIYYIPTWAVIAQKEGILFFKDQGELFIKTLEGDMHVTVGDYVIQGVNGEIYPCKPDIFHKTYEIVDEI